MASLTETVISSRLDNPAHRFSHTRPGVSAGDRFFAGGFAGCIGILVTSPLEVVKTRLQSAHNRSFLATTYPSSPVRLSVANAFRNIYRTDGVKAFWRGLGPNLFGAIPARAIWFSSYELVKDLLKQNGYSSDHPGPIFAAGVCSGAIVSTMINPISVVKTRMQLQTSRHSESIKQYLNSVDCVRRICREEGLRGLYKGLSASYIGISESSIQLVLYESFKRRFKNSQNEDLSKWQIFLSGSFAKLIASSATYPHEVVRTRLREQKGTSMQSKYRGFLQTMKLIWVEEGVRGMYGGMGAHLIRVVPNAAILFLTYEFVLGIMSENS